MSEEKPSGNPQNRLWKGVCEDKISFYNMKLLFLGFRQVIICQ